MSGRERVKVLTDVAKLIRQKHKKEIIKRGLKEKEIISKQQKTISIVKRRLRSEADAELETKPLQIVAIDLESAFDTDYGKLFFPFDSLKGFNYKE